VFTAIAAKRKKTAARNLKKGTAVKSAPAEKSKRSFIPVTANFYLFTD